MVALASGAVSGAENVLIILKEDLGKGKLELKSLPLEQHRQFSRQVKHFPGTFFYGSSFCAAGGQELGLRPSGLSRTFGNSFHFFTFYIPKSSRNINTFRNRKWF